MLSAILFFAISTNVLRKGFDALIHNMPCKTFTFLRLIVSSFSQKNNIKEVIFKKVVFLHVQNVCVFKCLLS